MNSRKVFLRQRVREYLATMPDATEDELAALKEWVADGNDPYDNPSLYCDDSGCPMDFISALRFERELVEAWLAQHPDLS